MTTNPAEIPAAVRQILADALDYLYPAALRVAVEGNVAEHLAAGPASPAELAERTGMHADHLRRVLRFLATREVFREDDEGRFHLTTAANVLRADFPVSLRNVVLLFTDDMYWRTAGNLDQTVLRGNSVFDKEFGAQIFDYLPTDAERTALFTDAMADLSTLEHDGMAEAYDFPETGTVIDVAGGLGGMLHAVLTRNPGLRGVLAERPDVLARHRLADPAVEDRWEATECDFLDTVPSGGDVYLLKRIIHDKSDEEAVRILRTVREAMSSSARLLILDIVAPPDGTQPSIMSDILMMTVFEGRERTEAELTELLSAADLKLARVLPTPSAMSIAEVVVN